MKHVISVLLAVLFCFYGSSCGDDDDICIRGSGTLNTYDDFNLSSFDEISVSGPISINIIPGAAADLVVHAEPELFAILEIEVDGNRLEARFPRNAPCIDTDLGVTLDVTVPSLNRISVSGQSVIQTMRDFDFEDFVLDISGEADVALNGTASEMTINCSGVVNARNFGLITNRQFINIAGVGDIELQCDIELTLVVSGTANIRYRGNPQISQSVSGTLTLTDAN